MSQTGLISLGSQDHICNYVLTRVWSPAAQEVALQLGDDDVSRLFVNNELILQTRFNGGSATPREYEALVTLKPGWNTILLKVQNTFSASWALLVLSDTEPDLIAARRGTEAIRAVFEGIMSANTVQDVVLSETVYKTTGDMSVGWGRFKLTLVPKAGGEPVVTLGRYIDVAERRNGGWVYVSDHASAEPPPPATADSQK